MLLFPNGVQGLSDTKYQGLQGSLHRLVGLDYRSEPGIIKVNQKLTKSSGEVVDELCKVSLPLSDGSTLWFSSESGFVWREVSGTWTNITVLEIPGYTFNLRTTVNTGKTKNVSTQINIPTGSMFNDDGTKWYIMGNADVSGNNGEIFQYTLTTAYDISTATYASKTFVADLQAIGFYISPDGTKVYISEDGGSTSVIEYALSTAWDISTASATGDTYDFSAQGTRGTAVFFKTDGTEMYVLQNNDKTIYSYTLSTAWDLSTASFNTSKVLTDGVVYGGGMYISNDGTKLLIPSTLNGASIVEYKMTTAWDISTATRITDFEIETNGIYFGFTAANDGSGWYIGSQDNPETYYQYSLTSAAEDLNVTVLGAEEYFAPAIDAAADADPVSHVYFATQNWLLRIPLTDIATDWNGTAVPNYEYISLFTNGDDTYHPFKKQNGRLYIGDKHVITEVNEAGVVTLETPFNVAKTERITALEDFDVDILVATKEQNKAWVKRWDTESDSWYAQDWIPEKEITAFLKDDNYVYAIAIDFGRMYYYDGEKLHNDKRIPGQYTASDTIKVNPNAVGFFLNTPVFGVSQKEGNAAWQGVYGYGRFSKDYNITLSLDFPLSCDVFEEIEIGSILVDGSTLMVSWKTDTTVGVDKIDWTAKYESAFFETTTLVNPKDRSKFKALKEMLGDYVEMPSGTSLEYSIENNYAGFNDIEPQQKVDAKLNQVRATSSQKEMGAVRAMVEFNVNGNETPVVENFNLNFDGEK